jgi:cation transport ATPase
MGRKSRLKRTPSARPYRSVNTRSSTRILLGAGAGAVLGVVLLSVGLIRAAVALIAGNRLNWSEWASGAAVAAVYCGAFALAGAVLGWLWPRRRSRAGAYALGYIGSGIVAIMIGLMVMHIKQDQNLYAFTGVVVILTLFWGSVLGREIQKNFQ